MSIAGGPPWVGESGAAAGVDHGSAVGRHPNLLAEYCSGVASGRAGAMAPEARFIPRRFNIPAYSSHEKFCAPLHAKMLFHASIVPDTIETSKTTTRYV